MEEAAFMSIVTFYRGDPKNAPKTTMPAHLGANAILTCKGKLLLERRRIPIPGGWWAEAARKPKPAGKPLPGRFMRNWAFGFRKTGFKSWRCMTTRDGLPPYRDGSVWRMVIVVYGLDFPEEPALRISAESKELRFFSREELKEIEIAVTHEDIVRDWFADRG